MSTINVFKISKCILPVFLATIIALITIMPAFAFAEAVTQQYTQSWIESILWSMVSGIFGGLVYVTGMLLDWAILKLILEFGTLFQTSGLGVGINLLWSIVRDLFNLTFIFGLIFIGFQLILNSGSSSAKKAIGHLLIAALVVNFSLFITKTVIDFSNIAAVQVAQVIYRTSGNTPNPSISVQFVNQMGLATVWNNAPLNRAANGGTNTAPTTGYLYIFGSMIVFCVAAFSFAAGAVLLFTRFIALNFMMILSPIMFLGLVFSSFSSYSKDYWKKFLNYCFFAPAFLLMLYFSLYILGTFTGMVRNNSAIGSGLTNSSGVDGLAALLIGAGFLVGSVMLAQKMSIAGSSATMKFGNNIAGKARSATTNGLLALPRKAARGAIGSTGRKWDKSLEARGVRADSIRRGFAKSAAEAKFGGTKSAKSVKDSVETAERFAARTEAVSKIDASIKANSVARTNPSLTLVEKNDAKIAMESALVGASNEQVSNLLGKYKGAERENLIANMSNSQFEAVMKAKDEDFNDSDKNEIATIRATSVKNALTTSGQRDIATAEAREEVRIAEENKGTSPDEAKRLAAVANVEAAVAQKMESVDLKKALEKSIGKATPDQLKLMGVKVVESHASGLSFGQIDDIKKGKEFTETEKGIITKAHETAWITKFASGANAATILNGLKDTDVAKLPKDILLHRATGKYFKPSMLNQILSAYNSDDRIVIKSNLKDDQGNYHKPEVEKWLLSNAGLVF